MTSLWSVAISASKNKGTWSSFRLSNISNSFTTLSSSVACFCIQQSTSGYSNGSSRPHRPSLKLVMALSNTRFLCCTHANPHRHFDQLSRFCRANQWIQQTRKTDHARNCSSRPHVYAVHIPCGSAALRFMIIYTHSHLLNQPQRSILVKTRWTDYNVPIKTVCTCRSLMPLRQYRQQTATVRTIRD